MPNKRRPDKHEHKAWLTDAEWSELQKLAHGLGTDFTGLVRQIATGDLTVTKTNTPTED